MIATVKEQDSRLPEYGQIPKEKEQKFPLPSVKKTDVHSLRSMQNGKLEPPPGRSFGDLEFSFPGFDAIRPFDKQAIILGRFTPDEYPASHRHSICPCPADLPEVLQRHAAVDRNGLARK
jgi:hypothetical protein